LARAVETVEWRDLARAVERERIELFVMIDPT
jgi:hypothetical protein